MFNVFLIWCTFSVHSIFTCHAQYANSCRFSWCVCVEKLSICTVCIHYNNNYEAVCWPVRWCYFAYASVCARRVFHCVLSHTCVQKVRICIHWVVDVVTCRPSSVWRWRWRDWDRRIRKRLRAKTMRWRRSDSPAARRYDTSSHPPTLCDIHHSIVFYYK